MHLRTWYLFLLAGICLILSGCNPKHKAIDANSASSPEQLVEIVEATLQEMKAYSFDLDMHMEVTAQGVEQKMDSEYKVKIEKPDRWAILLESGMMGGTSVSDGKNLTKYSQMLQKYSVEPLSEDQEMETSQVGLSQSYMLLGAAGFSRLFMGEGLKDWLLDGVLNSEFAEDKKVDGKTCRVATFQQENGMHWEIAVATGPRPLLRQFVLKPDFTKMAEQQTGMPKGMKLKVFVNFSNWKTDAHFDEDDFVFVPPTGAKKVESLFAQLGGREQLHPLVGEQAPSFSAKDLDGQTVELDQFAGEDVVILDFWATWCGPCVDALPIIAKVAKEFKDKHIVFYAVNLRETPEKIREFLTSEDIDAPVLLDEEGSISKLFQVSGIPQTVLIDKEGRVQVVHVGFGGNLEKQLTKELEDILAGKNLATASVEEREKASEQAAPIEATGMALVWTREGQFSDLAVDVASESVFVLNRSGDLAVITSSGDLLRTVPLPDAGSLLRSGTLVGDKAADLITFGPWGNTLNAYSQSGELLWTKSEESGIDDVQLADLFEDGTDDVIIGFNGAGGLTVLDNQGKQLWNNSTIGNVWHVTAGKFTQDVIPARSDRAGAGSRG